MAKEGKIPTLQERVYKLADREQRLKSIVATRRTLADRIGITIVQSHNGPVRYGEVSSYGDEIDTIKEIGNKRDRVMSSGEKAAQILPEATRRLEAALPEYLQANETERQRREKVRDQIAALVAKGRLPKDAQERADDAIAKHTQAAEQDPIIKRWKEIVAEKEQVAAPVAPTPTEEPKEIKLKAAASAPAFVAAPQVIAQEIITAPEKKSVTVLSPRETCAVAAVILARDREETKIVDIHGRVVKFSISGMGDTEAQKLDQIVDRIMASSENEPVEYPLQDGEQKNQVRVLRDKALSKVQGFLDKTQDEQEALLDDMTDSDQREVLEVMRFLDAGMLRGNVKDFLMSEHHHRYQIRIDARSRQVQSVAHQAEFSLSCAHPAAPVIEQRPQVTETKPEESTVAVVSSENSVLLANGKALHLRPGKGDFSPAGEIAKMLAGAYAEKRTLTAEEIALKVYGSGDRKMQNKVWANLDRVILDAQQIGMDIDKVVREGQKTTYALIDKEPSITSEAEPETHRVVPEVIQLPVVEARQAVIARVKKETVIRGGLKVVKLPNGEDITLDAKATASVTILKELTTAFELGMQLTVKDMVLVFGEDTEMNRNRVRAAISQLKGKVTPAGIEITKEADDTRQVHYGLAIISGGEAVVEKTETAIADKSVQHHVVETVIKPGEAVSVKKNETRTVTPDVRQERVSTLERSHPDIRMQVSDVVTALNTIFPSRETISRVDLSRAFPGAAKYLTRRETGGQLKVDRSTSVPMLSKKESARALVMKQLGDNLPKRAQKELNRLIDEAFGSA